MGTGATDILGWVSMAMATAILGMGGAPIAEKFGYPVTMQALQWIAYGSVAVLCVASLIIGGIGIKHGVMVILGKEIETLKGEPVIRQPLPAPIVEPAGTKPTT